MLRENFDHGLPQADWEAAKAEARELMIKRARRGGLITYSELVQGIHTITLEPHGSHLAHLLGEIAFDEDAAGRGLLTVVVVHKTGDKMPGDGFFKMAVERGRDAKDKVALWVEEMRRVQDVWKGP